MKLEHIAMYVNDLENTRLFFMQYFGAISNKMYHNPQTGLRTYFLSFEDGARLEIMSRPDMSDAPKKQSPDRSYPYLFLRRKQRTCRCSHRTTPCGWICRNQRTTHHRRRLL